MPGNQPSVSTVLRLYAWRLLRSATCVGIHRGTLQLHLTLGSDLLKSTLSIRDRIHATQGDDHTYLYRQLKATTHSTQALFLYRGFYMCAVRKTCIFLPHHHGEQQQDALLIPARIGSRLARLAADPNTTGRGGGTSKASLIRNVQLSNSLRNSRRSN